MSGVEDIHRFLEALAEADRSRVVASSGGPFPFVTISRQAGAGGHSLAEVLLRRLEREPDRRRFGGWQICDQKLCELLIQDPQLHVSMQALLTEEYHSELREFINHFFSRQTPQQLVFMKLFAAIRGFAAAGKVIIVGRAGSQVTGKLATGVHLRLVAPLPVRVSHLMKRLHQSEAQAARTAQQQDRERARLLHDFFQVNIDDPLLYDAVWNTGRASLETIAEAVVLLLRQRLPAPG